ncbi:MAG: hypothetical protein WC861_05295 [Candidatus Micrarchaeia archaeon]|jgi:hypothetical protein
MTLDTNISEKIRKISDWLKKDERWIALIVGVVILLFVTALFTGLSFIEIIMHFVSFVINSLIELVKFILKIVLGIKL